MCSPIEIPKWISQRIEYDYQFFLDKDILPGIDREKWAFRPNWHFQQCAKLFQKVTIGWYLTWDCDTIALRKISFMEENKPIYYSGWEQLHEPYFEFQKEMIGIGRVAPFTFIADMNLIYRPYINEMVNKNGYTINSFIEKSQEIITNKLYMAEPELYGSYIWANHREEYLYKKLKQVPFEGRLHRGEKEFEWPEKDIEDKIDEYENGEYDTVAIHSWFIEKGIN